MQTEISNDEFIILNGILDKMPLNEYFFIGDLHQQHILKPKFINDDNGYQQDMENFIRSKTYKNVTNYLVEQGYVERGGSGISAQNIRLNKKGELLQAYGTIQKLQAACIPLDEREIIADVPRIIGLAPHFGEFLIKGDDAISSDKPQMVAAHKQQLKDEDVLQYLVKEGFAYNRHDVVIDKTVLYRTLTERGRKLKELGSIGTFGKWETSEKTKEINRVIENDNLRQTNILSGKIQRNLLSINRWIAVAGIVAALYYLTLIVDYYSALIYKKYPLYYGKSVTVYLLLLGGLIGACTTITLIQLRKAIKKRQSNNT